ncbi:hypothetical protein ABFA07_015767 [Porites harrisoni]
MNPKVVKLLLLLVAVSYSNGRFYQTLRTNEAREKVAEDHSLSRFMGSKRAVGDDIEQLADLVRTNKQRRTSFANKAKQIVKYVNSNEPKKAVRMICIYLGCTCDFGPEDGCGCSCTNSH